MNSPKDCAPGTVLILDDLLHRLAWADAEDFPPELGAEHAVDEQNIHRLADDRKIRRSPSLIRRHHHERRSQSPFLCCQKWRVAESLYSMLDFTRGTIHGTNAGDFQGVETDGRRWWNAGAIRTRNFAHPIDSSFVRRDASGLGY